MNLSTFSKKTVVYAMGNIGLRAASFLLIPLYTHCLSKTDFGILSILLIVMQIYVVVMNAGTIESLIRYFKEENDKDRAGQLVGGGLVIIVCWSFVIMGVSYFFCQDILRKFLHIHDVTRLLIFVALAGFAQVLSNYFMGIFRVKGMAFQFMLTGFFSAILLFILTAVIFIKTDLDVLGVMAAQITAFGLTALMAAFFALGPIKFKISLSSINKIFRFGFPLLFSTASWFLIESSAIFFLSYYSTFEQVAIYALGVKLASIVTTVLNNPFQLSFEPYIYSNLDKPEEMKNFLSRVLTFFVFIFLCISFLVLAFSRILITFVAPEGYSASLEVLLFSLPLSLWLGFFLIGRSLFHINSKTSVTAILSMIFCFLILVLNRIFIPEYGYKGALLASNIIYFGAGVVMLFLGLRKFSTCIEWGKLSFMFLLMGVVFGGYYVCLTTPDASFNIFSAILLIIFIFIVFSDIIFSSDEKAQVKLFLKRYQNR